MLTRVLVVDDTAFMRMMIREILQRNGYEVAGEASSGEEAVRLYVGLRPDLVTLDITMPGMDGVDTVKALLQKDKAARIIIVSAMGQKDMIIKMIQAGARDFVVKPFVRERVLEALQRVSQGPTNDDPKAVGCGGVSLAQSGNQRTISDDCDLGRKSRVDVES